MTRYTHRQENANHKEEGKNQLKVTPVIVRQIFSWMKRQQWKLSQMKQIIRSMTRAA